MNAKNFRARLKPWVLPMAMVLGMVFHNALAAVSFLSPCLIFVMLLITYCRVDMRHFRIDGGMWCLLAIQVLGAVGVYFILRPLNELVAQGAFLCVFCPTATAAPVVTGMLGGSVPRVAAFSVLSYAAVALLAPPLLTWLNPGTDIPFADTMLRICRMVVPMIVGPMVVAALMKRFVPTVHRQVAQHQGMSFYIWAVALLLVVGTSVGFVMREPASAIPLMVAMAVVSLAVCLGQFWLGRRIGRRYGDPVSASQSLGQKNTVLVIWLALTYFNPIVSIAPAAYIVWHNTVNSWQLARN